MSRVKQVLPKVLAVTMLAGVAAGGWFGVQSEAFQRALGKREDTRLAADQPRPEAPAISLQQVYTGVVPDNPSTVALVSTITVDAAAPQVAKEDVTRNFTGKGAMQADAASNGTGAKTDPQLVTRRVWTPEASFSSGPLDSDPWTTTQLDGSSRSTYFDPHLVPVMNDVIGLELAAMPWRSPKEPVETTDGQLVVPHIAPTLVSDDLPDMRRWTFDLATFRAVSPVALAKTPFGRLDPTTLADVTMGFDTDGVLRYLQVTIDPAVTGPSIDGVQVFSMEWRVADLLESPVEIALPAGLTLPAPTP